VALKRFSWLTMDIVKDVRNRYCIEYSYDFVEQNSGLARCYQYSLTGTLNGTAEPCVKTDSEGGRLTSDIPKSFFEKLDEI